MLKTLEICAVLEIILSFPSMQTFPPLSIVSPFPSKKKKIIHTGDQSHA